MTPFFLSAVLNELIVISVDDFVVTLAGDDNQNKFFVWKYFFLNFCHQFLLQLSGTEFTWYFLEPILFLFIVNVAYCL